MSSKRYLGRGSEDSNVTRVPGFCRKYESKFGEIKLACDLLHLMIRKALRLGQHGQRIPAEALLRNHVPDVISKFHERKNLPPNALPTRVTTIQHYPLSKLVN